MRVSPFNSPIAFPYNVQIHRTAMFHFFQTVSSFFLSRPLVRSLACLLDEFGIIVVAAAAVAAVVVFSLINSLLELFTVAFFYIS